MFDEILKLVKEHLGQNPQINSSIPANQADEIHNEIASHVANGLSNQNTGGGGDFLSKIENSMTSGSPVASAIEGGLVGSLTAKFGLPPSVTGAIAGMLPGLLQKFAQKSSNSNTAP